jgi:hypothetical protein
MGWWERYQAWQPETSWDKYQAWRLESRTRFVATSLAVRAPVVFLLLWLVSGWSAGEALLQTTGLAVLTLVFGWLWYPRAKAKQQHTSVPRPMTGS